METRRIATVGWIVAAFLAGLALVATVYAVAVPTHRLGMALRATARWSLLWFCLATYGGALAALFGARFQALARRGRDFGLAFAAAQTVHFGLVVWLFYAAPDAIPPMLYLIVFFIGVFWVYVLAALSLSSRLSTWLGAKRCKVVRQIGVEYLAFAFAFDFAARALAGNLANALHYAPLLAVAAGGPVLRIAAAIKRRTSATNTPRALLN
jgi:sulfoxide reductase heme-binding subunit YedZ